jgi:hypothetical protein
MFADPNYNGKFQNEYDGIENASVAPPMTYEEAVEKVREALRQRFSQLGAYFNQLAEGIAAVAAVFARASILIKAQINGYPNKRVLHLARHSKKERVRKKNINRIAEWMLHNATML